MADYRPNTDSSNDQSYIVNFGDWDAWPFCPIKRYPVDGGLETAYLLATTDTLDALQQGRVRVSLGNIFMPMPSDPVVEYESFAVFFAAGWMVD